MHKKQEEIYLDQARFKVVSAGRRFGKTLMAAWGHIELSCQNKKSWWIAPTYPIAEIGWRAIQQIASQIPIAKVRAGDKMVSIGGGWVQVKSADSDGGLRGEGLDFITMDEAGHVRNLKDVWEQELRPALADRKGGALFISTPKGYNDFYELWKRSEFDPEYKSWQVPSWFNPFLDPDEIESAKKSLPALVFRQEFGAEFVQLAGAMFKREYFEVVNHVPSSLQNTVRFWDLAASKKTMADFTAGAKIALDNNGTLFILDVVRDRYEWPELLRVFKRIANQDGNEVRHGVETAGTQKGFLDMLLAEPTLAGVSISGFNPVADKVTRAQPFLARAEQGKVRLLRGHWNDAFMDEVCAFPEGQHDDQVDAVTGAISMCSGPAAAIAGVDPAPTFHRRRW